MGPAKMMPHSNRPQCAVMDKPVDTTPQAYAHMGGNQVMGLKSSATALSLGTVMSAFLALHNTMSIVVDTIL